jgi:hypothetical protein
MISARRQEHVVCGQPAFVSEQDGAELHCYMVRRLQLSKVSLCSSCPPELVAAVPKVCVFSRESGPLIKQWSNDMPATFVHQGREYRRYRLSRLVSDREIDESFVYASCAVTPADEMLIFHALYPGVGGVFTIEADSIQP